MPGSACEAGPATLPRCDHGGVTARGVLALVVFCCWRWKRVGAGAPTPRPPLKKGIWGPAEFAGESQFPIYGDLGVGIFQTPLRWAAAPTRPANAADPADPAYRWPADLDRAVSEGARYGIRVSVMLVGSPGWANGGGRPWYWCPSASRTSPTSPARPRAAIPRCACGWSGASRPAAPTSARWSRPVGQGHPHGSAGAGAALLRQAARRHLRGAEGAAARANLVIGGNTFTVGEVSPYNWIRYARSCRGGPARGWTC